MNSSGITRTRDRNLHEMNRSETTPIPKDQLLDESETHIEYRKSKKKVLHKDSWRIEKKRFSDKMEEFWKGKRVYKIKDDYEIPEDIVRSDVDRQAKLFRGDIDVFFTLSQPLLINPVYRRSQAFKRERQANRF